MSELSVLKEAFHTIYEENQWGEGSGPGSRPSNTIEYRAFIERFMEANAIHDVTDLGCGDWQFSHLVDWSRINYFGLDLVPGIVARNQERFGRPNVRFKELTSLHDLPGGDLLLAKEVLQHLPNQTIGEYLAMIRRKYRFALLTNAIEPAGDANLDIVPGGYRPLRLQDAPFYAAGAVVFTYFHNTKGMIWKNATFLMQGVAA